jgi:predicted DNA binding CopG/RHH family protein
MTKIGAFEKDVLNAYEKGELRSTSPSKAQLRKYKEAARATWIKDRRVNIRISTPDLNNLKVRALEEGIPYQTLMASVLHKFVTGRLAEKTPRRASRPSKTTRPPESR